MCRQSDLEGPVSPLDSSVARCPVPDGLRVSLQRGIRGSCVGGSGQRRTMRGVGEVIWRVSETRRPCCGREIVFIPSSSCPSVPRIC